MTVAEALKLILKPRCVGVNCAVCKYLASMCDDSEIVEIVKTLQIHPLTFKEVIIDGKRVIVGYVSDHSGNVVYPEGRMPPKPTINVVDIGLLDEVTV